MRTRNNFWNILWGIALVIIVLAVTSGGCVVNYYKNKARYPDAPSWTHWFK